MLMVCNVKRVNATHGEGVVPYSYVVKDPYWTLCHGDGGDADQQLVHHFVVVAAAVVVVVVEA
jgi:hypothetical protein